MKIRVEHEDGKIETLDIGRGGTIIFVNEGRERDHIQTPDGMEYYFTADGYYDGWARDLPAGTSPEAAAMAEEIINRRRRIEDPKGEQVN